MITLVVGATGATGSLLVTQLLERGQHVRVIVRAKERLPPHLRQHEQVSITESDILMLPDEELRSLVHGCDAIASCLGHNLTFSGVFGQPRKLVTEATQRLCRAATLNAPNKPIRFILMNTTGNKNRDLNEKTSFLERSVVSLIRLMVPPHADNETAAEYLRVEVGHNADCIEWVAVRPDSLIDRTEVSPYQLHESPIRSAIFDAGKTSRVNVAHFMTTLITDDESWETWKAQMPVIYNQEDESRISA
jgi:nucleoside-diphosphate-sugar epimerase